EPHQPPRATRPDDSQPALSGARRRVRHHPHLRHGRRPPRPLRRARSRGADLVRGPARDAPGAPPGEGTGRGRPPVPWPRIPRWHPLVLVSLALSAWVYFPITRVYFHADDLLHLLTIADEGPLAFILKPFGGHAYLARNVMFVASYDLFGLRSEAYYWVVLLTHLLNVALLFATLHAFTRSALLACFGAALWGTSPLAVGTIGWYSVYGHAMVATILLIVLGQLTRLVASDSPLTTRTAGLWYVLLLLGVVSFGTGIGVAFAFPAVLFLLMPSAWRRPGLRAIWITLPLVTLAVYFVARRAYLLIAPLPVTELLGEVMVWHGLYALPPDVAHMLGFGVASVVLGF